MKTSFPDHFSSKAASYQQFRPGYPVELFEYLTTLTSENERALDCATGSGQAAAQLGQYFTEIVAFDGSAQQVQNAQTHDHVNYVVNTSEQLPFKDKQFDLVTVAQALHWFDQVKFYAEVKRVLKPGGLLAVWSYSLMKVMPEIDQLVWHLYKDILGPYWAFERQQVEQGYQNISFPFTEISVPEFAMTAEWTLEHLTGYLSTWSALQKYIKDNDHDPLQAMVPEFAQAWGEKSKTQQVCWPLSIRVGKI
ncbi:MAG: class I SAM-dependent methyltransferase [Gammaproteobacteria bacterium]|nr:class I SAM-dependent methyltransferase [Gammaproteobacteria bacterium]